MPTVSRTSATRNVADTGAAQLAQAMKEIVTLNRSAELGSASIRFTGKSGGLFGAQELTPEQAMLEFMAGNPVEATRVSWRSVTTSGGKRGGSSTYVARSKVRGSKVRNFNTTGRGKETPERFAEWLGDELAKGDKPVKKRRAPTTSRASHPHKR